MRQQIDYTTKAGVILCLKPVPIFGITRINTQYNNKQPKPPTVYVEVEGKKIPQVNMLDPLYQLQLEQWAQEKIEAQSLYLLGVGVTNEVPSEFAREQREYFPDISDSALRCLWVTTVLDNDELTYIMGLLRGANEVTPEGLIQAEADF